MRVVGDHAGPVSAVAFTPNGRGLASAAKDGPVQLWHLDGGAPIQFKPAPESVLSLALSPDGARLAAGGKDGAVQLWRLDGEPDRFFGPFDAPVCCVTFLARGQYLAAAIGNRINAAEPGELRLWRMSDFAAIGRLGEPNGVWALAAAAEHKWLAWSSGARRVTIWEMTAQDRHNFPPLKSGATALAMSHDGQWLAAGDDWVIHLWDVRRREDRATLTGHKGRVSALAFSPDGRQLLSGAGDRRLITWDLETGRKHYNVDWDLGRVTALAIAPDGLSCAAGGDAGKVVVWDRE
jgi:WD40 repeat protein